MLGAVSANETEGQRVPPLIVDRMVPSIIILLVVYGKKTPQTLPSGEFVSNFVAEQRFSQSLYYQTPKKNRSFDTVVV